ncbi:MAG: site-specific DNA-methyltransferase, partial [Spirochaetales bacterium]|nr:site-specific DNA-methyltransferase [Spirochaetales bacterium]
VGNQNTAGLSSGEIDVYISSSREWVRNTLGILAPNAFLYIWLGADQSRNFQPLPDFMIMMREFPSLDPKSFITMRNQRGYGTQKNWMFVRQELLCYTTGEPDFTVTYTDIPKILRGYYKQVGNRLTENLERSRSENIRPGNVWVDIQQVFYRMEENVPGAYAQKPIRAIERIITTSSNAGDTVGDLFSHSGTTLIAAERTGRRCITCDYDPVFTELTIRRLEHFRKTGKTGWQTQNPFPELDR